MHEKLMENTWFQTNNIWTGDDVLHTTSKVSGKEWMHECACQNAPYKLLLSRDFIWSLALF